MGKLSCAIAGAVIASGFCAARGLASEPFESVPVYFTRSHEVFKEVFQRGRCFPVRGVVFGDSQESSPNGRGDAYMPRLNYELWLRYGNSPETPLISMLTSSGDGAPWAAWLGAGATASPGPTATRVPASSLPPNLTAAKMSALNGNNVNNNQRFGQMLFLLHDGSRITPDADIVPGEYFVRGDQCFVDVFAATAPSSGEVVVKVRPADRWPPNFFAPVIAQFTTSMNLQRPGPSRVVSQRIGPFTVPAGAYVQVELGGSDPSKFTDVVGAKFASVSAPQGVTLSSLAAGPYTVADLLSRHSDSWGNVAALNPDVAYFCFGAYDCLAYDARTYQANLRSAIGLLRAAARRDVPVVLIADVYRAGLTVAQQRTLDLLPEMCYELSLELPNVMSINSRRLLHGLGWNATTGSEFLADDLNYTGRGARLKAFVDTTVLIGWYNRDRACVADANVDCSVTSEDLELYIELFNAGDPSADLDDGTGTRRRDGRVDDRDFLFFLDRYAQGC